MNKFFKCEEDFRVKVDIFRPSPKSRNHQSWKKVF